MNTYQFSREPKKVPIISTKNRIIKTSIPCEGTKEILESLDTFESRSMHGQIPIVWESAKDFNIFDLKGNKFIDFTSAIFFSNVGHSNPRVLEAMREMLEKPIMGCYAYGNEIRSRYLKKLLEFTGPGFDKAFLLSAGTEATDAALKLMRLSGQSKNKKRLGVISLENNWHGRTMGAQMMSGNLKQKEWIGFNDKDIHHLAFPYPWELNDKSGESFFMKNIELLIKNKEIDPKNDLCGMILESFQGWGAIFYPKDFVKAAEKFCKENDIILTFDEMQAGFARTGKAFGFQHYEVSPDLICCGKGMGNGYPLSGVIGKKNIMDLPEIGNMSSTHSANPMACAIGLAVIEEIEKRKLIEESIRKGNILHSKLNELQELSKGRISFILGEGLISAILFQDKNSSPDSKTASIIVEKCYEKGLLVVHTGRESIKLGPPLTISDDALLEGIEVLINTTLDIIN